MGPRSEGDILKLGTIVLYSRVILIVVFFWPSCYAQEVNVTQPEVTISQETLRGTTLTTRRNRTISGFLGIPYAQPPVGGLRAAYANRAFQLGGYVGCSNDTSVSLITCLRGINASDILATYSEFYVRGSLPSTVWTPTDKPDIDGAVLTDSPANIFAAGGMRDLPRLTGVLPNDGFSITASFYNDEEAFSDFLISFDNLLPELLTLTSRSDGGAAWIKAFKSYYFNDDLTANTSELLASLTRLAGDTIYIYPNYNALQQQLQLAVNPQYLYSFNYKGTLSYSFQTTGSLEDYGVVHGDDIIYLFPHSDRFSGLNITRSESDFQMVDAMVDLWTSFVINGVPKTSANDNNATWEAYTSEDNFLQIGNNSDLGLEVQHTFFKERMQFRASLVSATSTSGVIANHPNLFLALLLSIFKIML